MKRTVLASFLLGLSCAGFADVTVTKEDFEGWTDCYRISNDSVDVVVVPQIGRIMRYGLKGRENILWINPSLKGQVLPSLRNERRNYGGDNLTFATGSGVSASYDIQLDGPCEVKPTMTGVIMTGFTSGKQDIKFTRKIELAGFGPKVTITNGLENVADQRSLAVCQNTVCDDPQSATLVADVTSQTPEGWYGFGNHRLQKPYQVMSGRELTIARNPSKEARFGTQGNDGQIVVRKSRMVFTSKSPLIRGGEYPVGCAQRVLTSADPYTTMTIQQVGPLFRLDVREIAQQKVIWTVK